MGITFKLKEEVLFVTLASHAKYIVDNKNIYDEHIVDISRLLLKHFNKKSKRYTPKQADRLKKELSEVYEPLLNNNNVEIDVLLLSQLAHLYNENHTETCYSFPFKRLTVFTDIAFLGQCNETKEYLLEAEKMIGNYLYGAEKKFIHSKIDIINKYHETLKDSVMHIIDKTNNGNLDLYNFLLSKKYTDDVIISAILNIINKIVTTEIKTFLLKLDLSKIEIKNNYTVITCGKEIDGYIDSLLRRKDVV